jgi:multiple sugar transport system substrate-binding protein
MKRTKLIGFVSTALSLGLVLAGCSSNTATQGNNSKSSSSSSKNLVIWDWQTNKAEKELNAQFKKNNPNVSLQVQNVMDDQMATKLLAAASAHNLPDAAYLDGQTLAQFESAGILEPLDKYVDKWGKSKDFPTAIWNSLKFDNSVYGIPGDGDVRTLLYRKDVFQKAGLDPNNPPKTWSELLADAQKIQAVAKEANIQYAFALNGGDSEHTSMRSLPWIWDLGGDFVTKDGKPSLNNDSIVKTVQFMNDLVNKYKVAPPNSYLNTKKEVASLINSGDAAMAIVGSWEWNSDSSYLAQKNLDGNLASAPIPLPDGSKADKPYTAAGYGVWVIFKDSKAKDSAWKYIEQATSPDYEVKNFKYGSGNIPTRISAFKDPVFSSNPIYKGFIDLVPNARPRTSTTNYDLLSQTYRKAVGEILNKNESVKSALDQAQQDVESQWK